MIELLQGVYFDICDLLDSEQVDNIQLEGFEEFSTLREFLEEQKAKLEQVEQIMGGEVDA